MNCTLCDTLLENKADEYYFICSTCGAYVKDEKYYVDSEKEKQRYEEHNNDVADEGYRKFTSPITNAILKNQNKAQLGLDYGCGTGPVIAEQLKENEFQIKLFDPYFFPEFDYLNYQYDYIFSCEVFEHFNQPKQEIEKLVQLLKHGGRLYIMTQLYNSNINFKNWYYRNDQTHVFIYTLKTIEFIVNKYNFKVEKITEKLIIAKKNEL